MQNWLGHSYVFSFHPNTMTDVTLKKTIEQTSSSEDNVCESDWSQQKHTECIRDLVTKRLATFPCSLPMSLSAGMKAKQ